MQRSKGESMNDRNDRAIRTAGLWYQNHLRRSSGDKVDVVLLTDDAGNRANAIREGLQAFSGILLIFFLFGEDFELVFFQHLITCQEWLIIRAWLIS